MGTEFASMTRPTASSQPFTTPRLPGDLARLRERFVASYPDHDRRLAVLAQSPAAVRHLLGLFLELDRADALPRHYRDLAAATLAGAPLPADPDAVDQLVTAYAGAAAVEPPSPAVWLPRLRRYFTESQIVELALWIALSQSLAAFDRMLAL